MYILGHPIGRDEKFVAIVGTRRPSQKALELARILARGAVARRYGVVTGAAPGVDTAAALAAIEAGGRLVAVGPCIYYRGKLWCNFNYVLKYRLGTAVAEREECRDVRRELAERNRLIAQLAEYVVVPEARCPSLPCRQGGWGTLYAVKHALRLKKHVYVCNPVADDPHVKAAHEYLRSLGAHAVNCQHFF